jgi:hypothetical protein
MLKHSKSKTKIIKTNDPDFIGKVLCFLSPSFRFIFKFRLKADCGIINAGVSQRGSIYIL